jgi:hypothetical protein
VSGRWAQLRWGVLLPAASRSRRFARPYAALVAIVESRRDPLRRDVAAARAARWLGVTLAEGAAVHRASLASEALEEADCAFFMRDESAMLAALRAPADEPPATGATVYGCFHLGSPILAYVYLRRVRGLEVGIVGRALDDTNPMPPAKRRFGQAKVAWLERVTGRPLLGVDAGAIARARAELVEGRSLYAALDVPGDVSARSSVVPVCGEPLRLATGIVGLAALAGAPIVPVVAVNEGGALAVHYGPAIAAGARGAGGPPLVEVAAAIGAMVRRFPREWWLWPYVTPG